MTSRNSQADVKGTRKYKAPSGLLQDRKGSSGVLSDEELRLDDEEAGAWRDGSDLMETISSLFAGKVLMPPLRR